MRQSADRPRHPLFVQGDLFAFVEDQIGNASLRHGQPERPVPLRPRAFHRDGTGWCRDRHGEALQGRRVAAGSCTVRSRALSAGCRRSPSSGGRAGRPRSGSRGRRCRVPRSSSQRSCCSEGPMPSSPSVREDRGGQHRCVRRGRAPSSASMRSPDRRCPYAAVAMRELRSPARNLPPGHWSKITAVASERSHRRGSSPEASHGRLTTKSPSCALQNVCWAAARISRSECHRRMRPTPLRRVRVRAERMHVAASRRHRD